MGRVFFGTRKNIVNVAAAKTLIASDSGSVFNINQASAYEITLPLSTTISDGWNATFVIGTVAANAVTIANNTAEDLIVGGIAGADGGAATHAETAVPAVELEALPPGSLCTISTIALPAAIVTA